MASKRKITYLNPTKVNPSESNEYMCGYFWLKNNDFKVKSIFWRRSEILALTPKNLKKSSKTENFESVPRALKHALEVFLGAKNDYLGVFSPKDTFLGILENKIFFVFLLSYPYLTIFCQNGP